MNLKKFLALIGGFFGLYVLIGFIVALVYHSTCSDGFLFLPDLCRSVLGFAIDIFIWPVRLAGMLNGVFS